MSEWINCSLIKYIGRFQFWHGGFWAVNQKAKYAIDVELYIKRKIVTNIQNILSVNLKIYYLKTCKQLSHNSQSQVYNSQFSITSSQSQVHNSQLTVKFHNHNSQFTIHNYNFTITIHNSFTITIHTSSQLTITTSQLPIHNFTNE